MERRKKKRQPRKKNKNLHGAERPVYPLRQRNPKDQVINSLLKSIREEASYIDTPFGDILIGSGMTLTTIRNKDFLYDLIVDDKAVMDKEADTLTQLINFEKLNDKYPNEPFIRHGIALCYNELKEKDKYEAIVTSSFEFFNREDPNIDASYLQLLIDQDDKELASNLIGEELNIHKIYPKLTIVDKETVEVFYIALTDIFLYRKDFETAKKCAGVINSVNPKAGRLIDTIIKYESDPRQRRKARMVLIAAIIGILAVLAGIIWGIVKFFRWIF